MTMLLALALMAMLAGLFYGLGSSPRRRALWTRPDPPALAAALPAPEALPGGDPGRALRVATPSVIEQQAERWPCPICASPVRCERHRAEQLGDRRLRVAEVRCRQCGYVRDVYFELFERRSN